MTVLINRGIKKIIVPDNLQCFFRSHLNIKYCRVTESQTMRMINTRGRLHRVLKSILIESNDAISCRMSKKRHFHLDRTVLFLLIHGYSYRP